MRYIRIVEIRDLKPEQHAGLEAQLSELLSYYHRQLDRLDRRRFPRDGEMFPRTLAAMKAAHALWEHIAFNPPRKKHGNGERLPF